MFKIFKRFSTYTLLVALAISAVAEFYSIVGLTTIFSAAVIPIIIMGVVLGLGKLTATVWLKMNWDKASISHKLYLIPAIVVLMFLTSMGIFGFLSKAHSDQSLISGDVQAKIAVYDEKIKISKENIDANRKALKQMDEAVDQVMGRSTDEKGADKAVAIRKTQQRERARLLSEIQAEQKTISTLNEERAPIAAEVRKVEAEVGPIKYIAAMIYGDSPDGNLLEGAVRWVIILIVAVFDPLALMLLLAAQQSMRWEKDQKQENTDEKEVEDFFTRGKLIARGLDADEDQRLADEANEKIAGIVAEEVADIIPEAFTVIEQPKSILEEHPYLNQPFIHFENLKPMVYKPEPEVKEEPNVKISKPKKKRVKKEKAPVVVEPLVSPDDIITDGITKEAQLFHPSQEYVSYEGKAMSINALKAARPDLILKDTDPVNQILFGNKFPEFTRTGDMYIRIDTLPHRVYKFNGKKWITIDKQHNSSYLQYIPYINYLIDKIGSGEYDAEMLTEDEQEEIARHLEKNKQ